MRSTRLCLFYHNFLNFFLKDAGVTQHITNAIIESGEDFESSELIKDLERLMNAGFKFDLEIERIESSIQEKSTTRKLKIFGRLKTVCKQNVNLIAKFIPIEIYPLFLKKKLEADLDTPKNSAQKVSNQEVDQDDDSSPAAKKNAELDTISRFTNAFIERIPDAKMSEKFKEYFAATYICFLNYQPIMENNQGNLTPAQKFV